MTFNYTLVLEKIYNISKERIIHIHGAIEDYNIFPVMGHGNKQIIDEMHKQAEEAREVFDEKVVVFLMQ